MHLRKNAWWAWAPQHDPADDHLYGWLRLDSDMQQQLSASLAGLEVPPAVTEEEQPTRANGDLEPRYDSGLSKPDQDATRESHENAVVSVVAAMQQTAVLDRRLFKLRQQAEEGQTPEMSGATSAAATRRARLGGATAAAAAVTVTVTVIKPPQQRHENPPQNPTKRVLQLYQAVRYVNLLKPRAIVQQNGERRGSWLEQPPSAAPR